MLIVDIFFSFFLIWCLLVGRAKGEAAAAHAALGGLSVASAESLRRGGPSSRGVPGAAPGGVGGVSGRDSHDSAESGGAELGTGSEQEAKASCAVVGSKYPNFLFLIFFSIVGG